MGLESHSASSLASFARASCCCANCCCAAAAASARRCRSCDRPRSVETETSSGSRCRRRAWARASMVDDRSRSFRGCDVQARWCCVRIAKRLCSLSHLLARRAQSCVSK